MMDQISDFDRFKANRDKLVGLGEQLWEVFDALDVETRRAALKKSNERLRSENFRLLVIGEFNAGKSTLLNAFLGEPILPEDAVECTAIPTEVKWGETARAVLYPKGDGPPITIPVRELKAHVTVKDTEHPREAMKESAYQNCEVFYPLGLCRDGVEIIDSPGLNAHELRERITFDYITTVDAVLFMLSAIMLGNMSELRVVDTLIKPAGHDDLFFVANKADLLSSGQLASVRRSAEIKIAPLTKRGMERVFFVSAKNALAGRIVGKLAGMDGPTADREARSRWPGLDSEDLESIITAHGTPNGEQRLIEASGLTALERNLADFLTNDRGRTKLVRAALEYRYGVQEARKMIPPQVKMLSLDLDTFEERQREAETPLRELQERRGALVAQVNVHLLTIRDEVTRLARKFMLETVSGIPQWAAEIELENRVKVGFNQSKMQAQIEVVSKELFQKLNERLQGHVMQWQGTAVQSLITERVTAIAIEFKGQLDKFSTDLNQVRLEMSFGGVESAAGYTHQFPSTLERIASAAGGLIIDPGAALTGATFGFRELMRRALPQAGIMAVGVATGWGALFILPASLALFMFTRGKREEELNDDIKHKIAGEFGNHLGAQVHDRSLEIGEATYKALTSFRDNLDASMQAQFKSLLQQVAAVRQDRSRGEANVKRRMTVLEELQTKLNTVDGALDDILSEVVTGQARQPAFATA